MQDISNIIIIEKIRKQSGGEKIAEILRDPKDELELQYANLYLQLYEDIMLVNEVIKNNEDINIENNIFIDFTCKYIKKVREKDIDGLKKLIELYNFSDYNNLAKMSYETIIALSQKQTYDIIISECNIDLSDTNDLISLIHLLEQAKKLLILIIYF